MSVIALFSVFLTSSVLWLFLYSLTSLSEDIFVTSQQSFMPNPNSFDMPDPTIPGLSPAQTTGPFRQLQEDLAIILVVEIAFFLASFIISFFSTFSTTLISAMSYKAKNLSLKELFSIICRKWTRPLITTFYVTAIVMGYFFVVSVLAAPLLVYRSKATLSVAILIGVVAFVFYLYLSVSWVLAVVISVVEESYGLKALGKAAALVEGKKLQGFLINVCFELLVLIIFCGYKVVLGYKGSWLLESSVMSRLFVVIFLGLVKIFVAVAYTVLYFKCKEDNGEEIELHGNIEYTKVQNTELGHDMA
ncbi:hypothetical protein PHJA_002885500 [Phtheirospermum japonicum]|uniref:Transmembrane protein n=1 Tax=Phtheirospermum japonicum TaxID=374723 RepID=A0A830DI60_9LAMI|nr:hypothetical protein PHJA_002885500 [Phtheirospermum japonicum]